MIKGDVNTYREVVPCTALMKRPRTARINFSIWTFAVLLQHGEMTFGELLRTHLLFELDVDFEGLK